MVNKSKSQEIKSDKTNRHEQIVEAALRRFSHFGIAKTSLTEVADDLALSKQSLSYYFPDKQSLVNAVVEKLTIEYGNKLRKEMQAAVSIELALLKLTQVKASFFETYFMLAIHSEHLEIASKVSCTNWRKFLTDDESGLLTILFERGMVTGELKVLDARKTSELFLETLYAFSRCIKDKGSVPDQQAFRELLSKQQEVIKIFYQGLKAESWLN